MTGLLDYIFQDMEGKNLDRTQIRAYIRYLDELILNGLPLTKELEYQALKLHLIKRMNAFNHEQLKFYYQHKAEKASDGGS